MRIRTIKPEFWRNRKLASLGREVHDFAARLISASDDEGYLEADPALIASEVYPFDADAQRFIKKSLPELERIGFIEVRGGEFGIGWLPKFREHQRINKPTPSRLRPRFEQLSGKTQVEESSTTTTGVLPESSPLEEEEEQGSGSGAGIGIGAEPAAGGPGPEDELGQAWNDDTTAPLPRVTLPLTKTRRTAAKSALERRPLSEWRAVFRRINASTFLRGADGGWKADFDWAIRAEGKKPESAMKVLEGAFDRSPTGPPPRDMPNPTPRVEGRVRL